MKYTYIKLLLSILSIFGIIQIHAQGVTVNEKTKSITTYPYYDPDPIANPSKLYYPYFRFDGFSDKGIKRNWKTVQLENDFIKITIFPEIGGKIWGAVDKTTGKEFIYNNGVVKFRDIAMRGPWTSGGIEFNFGIIGHAPTSSTPVDYLIKEKKDGSTSCYIFSYEWLTRTIWNVEVNIPKNKAYFTTHTTWYNQSSIDQPYYQWMNAGYPVGKNAQFYYPGDCQIGHGGEVGPFPIDEKGHNIGMYEKNGFGGDKSYHVLGYYNDFYGIYWHGEDYGSVHHADFDEKLGMKIFLWGQSREGGIWERLLTDNDGQYIELQSGRVFNQPASNSAYTPFKHRSFSPQMTDEWTEYWYPVKGIKGISKASKIGALHVTREKGKLNLTFCPVENLSTKIQIFKDDVLMEELALNTKVLEPVTLSPTKSCSIPEGSLKVIIGDNLLEYSEKKEDFDLERPTKLPENYKWNSVYGLFTKGEQWMNQKRWDEAEKYLKSSLEIDPYFSPALIRLASLYYREGQYQKAIELLDKSLSLDTYNAEANYLYGLANRILDKKTEAKAAFSIATFSAQFRTAAYEQLGEIYASEKKWEKAATYAIKSLEFNEKNLTARHLLSVIYRKTGKKNLAEEQIQKVLAQIPLYHPIRFEQAYLSGKRTVSQLKEFSSLIKNELPFETYIEMAIWYERIGCIDEAVLLLSCIEDNPIILYQKAYLLNKLYKTNEAKELVDKANSLSPDFVFPFRHETIKYLDWAGNMSSSWKPNYYKALIYWCNQQKEKARSCLEDCRNIDYAPFFLTRSLLRHGQEKLNDILKAESIENTWRVGLALMNYYYGNKDWKKVVEIGEKYNRRFPANYYIGLKYAKGLCENRQYTACLSILNNLVILPNEGAYAGRAVYRDANLYQAIDFLAQKKYNSALKSIKSSRKWPENLGVGKPYDNMLDERLEDFIEARSYTGMGNEDMAMKFYKKVIAGKYSNDFESANLLTALSLKETGKKHEADKMVATWNEKYPNNKSVQWCISIYNSKIGNVNDLLKSRSNRNETAPWESSYWDNNFNLILRLFQ